MSSKHPRIWTTFIPRCELIPPLHYSSRRTAKSPSLSKSWSIQLYTSDTPLAAFTTKTTAPKIVEAGANSEDETALEMTLENTAKGLTPSSSLLMKVLGIFAAGVRLVRSVWLTSGFVNGRTYIRPAISWQTRRPFIVLLISSPVVLQDVDIANDGGTGRYIYRTAKLLLMRPGSLTGIRL